MAMMSFTEDMDRHKNNINWWYWLELSYICWSIVLKILHFTDTTLDTSCIQQ